ncbi:MAG: hypothetical protein ACTSUE_19905 [Promethearchaeota archaeon]
MTNGEAKTMATKKKGKKKSREIRLCPKCKKPTLKLATNISGWMAPAIYECADPVCGYSGSVTLIIDPEEVRMVAGEGVGAGWNERGGREGRGEGGGEGGGEEGGEGGGEEGGEGGGEEGGK